MEISFARRSQKVLSLAGFFDGFESSLTMANSLAMTTIGGYKNVRAYAGRSDVVFLFRSGYHHIDQAVHIVQLRNQWNI
jgi:hypothetical protein